MTKGFDTMPIKMLIGTPKSFLCPKYIILLIHSWVPFIDILYRIYLISEIGIQDFFGTTLIRCWDLKLYEMP